MMDRMGNTNRAMPKMDVRVPTSSVAVLLWHVCTVAIGTYDGLSNDQKNPL